MHNVLRRLSAPTALTASLPTKATGSFTTNCLVRQRGAASASRRRCSSTVTVAHPAVVSNANRKYHGRVEKDKEGWCNVDDKQSEQGAKGIMVISTREHAGKTSISMALVSGLIRRFGVERVGYFKPFGQELVEVLISEIEEEEGEDDGDEEDDGRDDGRDGDGDDGGDDGGGGGGGSKAKRRSKDKDHYQYHHFAPCGAGSVREPVLTPGWNGPGTDRQSNNNADNNNSSSSNSSSNNSGGGGGGGGVLYAGSGAGGGTADEERSHRQRRRREKKVVVDRDALLAKAHFHLKDPLKVMSPLVVDKMYTRDFLEGAVDLNKQWNKVGDAYHKLRKQRDFVVVEGTAHSAAGSIIGMSSADVAARLGLEVILVATGGVGSTFDELALNRQELVNKGVRVRGVVINKVREDKLATVSSYAVKALKRWGTPLLACIPYGAGFDSPSLRDLELLYDAKLISGQQYALNRFLHYELVTTSLGRFMHKLNAPAREAEANVWRETAKEKARRAGVATRGESCSLVEPDDVLASVAKFAHAAREPLSLSSSSSPSPSSPSSSSSSSSSSPSASSSSSSSWAAAPAAADALLASMPAAAASSSSSAPRSPTPPSPLSSPPSSSSSPSTTIKPKTPPPPPSSKGSGAGDTPKGVLLESTLGPTATSATTWRNTCFVTHSSRADIILGLLSHMHDRLKSKKAAKERRGEYTGSAMLLTGDVKLPQYVLDYIRHSGFPVLMTGMTTSDSMRQLQQFSAKMHKDDAVRTNQVLELCEPCIDFDALLKSWRLNDDTMKQQSSSSPPSSSSTTAATSLSSSSSSS